MPDTRTSLSAFSEQLTGLVDRAAALVVAIDARHCGAASGLIVGPDLVVTADHVVEREGGLVVRTGGRQMEATLAGRDPASDIAVLRVPGLGGAEPPPAAEPRAGQLVVSVARTPSGGITAGLGIVSAVGGPLRTGSGVTLRQVIRSDTASRRGTSGGAIVDTNGGVLAMTTAGLVRGATVGVPIGQLMEIASALAASRSIRRAYLGVSVQPIRLPRVGPHGDDRGLLVFGVAPDGAADKGGLLVGDVIVAFNGAAVKRMADLQDALAGVDAGAGVTLDVSRGGAMQQLQVTTGARPSA
jgi:S1-C subfamily serine protease